jgi:hypothetical protein
MKKLFILLGLFVSLSLFGQGMNVLVTTHRPITPVGDTLGPEMITDGDFPNADNWQLQSMWSIGTNVASFDDTGSGYIRQIDGNMVSSITANTDYNLQFDVSNSAANATFQIMSYLLTELYVASDNYTNGHYSINFTTDNDVGSAGFAIYGDNASDNSWDITNVSLKERNP